MSQNSLAKINQLERAVDKLENKIIEILNIVDGTYDCKMICDKGNITCNNQCLKKGYWKDWCLKDEQI